MKHLYWMAPTGLILWIVIILMLTGCAYTGRNDPNIEWPGQNKTFYKSPRQIYFGA